MPTTTVRPSPARRLALNGTEFALLEPELPPLADYLGVDRDGMPARGPDGE